MFTRGYLHGNPQFFSSALTLLKHLLNWVMTPPCSTSSCPPARNEDDWQLAEKKNLEHRFYGDQKRGSQKYLFIVVPITIHIMDIDQKRVIDIYRLSISIHSG